MAKPTRAVFIAGTGTDVGKTVVAAAAVCLLRGAGFDAVPMKPIQTGCGRRAGGLSAPDLEFCLSAARMRPSRSEKRLMCPYPFIPACSPHMAAGLAERLISIPAILRALRTLQKSHDVVVIEGAGGIMVPIGPDKTMLDLIVRIGAPVILAAQTGLGTINHTLLALNELRRAGLSVPGVVFSSPSPRGWNRILRDNPLTVARFGRTRVLGVLPYARNLRTLVRAPSRFHAWAAGPLAPLLHCLTSLEAP